MVVLPPQYKKLIEDQMRDEGPRAVIQAMTDAMPAQFDSTIEAGICIEKMHATLVEILKNWPTVQ